MTATPVTVTRLRIYAPEQCHLSNTIHCFQKGAFYKIHDLYYKPKDHVIQDITRRMNFSIDIDMGSKVQEELAGEVQS